MKKYLASTGTLPLAMNKEFYEYECIPEIVKMLDIDGVELVFLPEWDSKFPPLTPSSANWNKVKKVSCDEITDYFIKHNVKVYSVHINRDVGNLLCSNNPDLVYRGQSILKENLLAGIKVGAEVAVLHLWDTYKEKLDLDKLIGFVVEVAKDYPIKITYENIPISDKELSSVLVWDRLYKIIPNNHGFTLDLNWSSFYNDFDNLKLYLNKILNVHVQGFVNNGYLTPRVGNLDIMTCLNNLNELNYNGLITLELTKVSQVQSFIDAIKIIKTRI